MAQTALSESRDVPAGHLRVSTTVGVGTVWLTAHLISTFLDIYPDITVSMMVTDGELDLSHARGRCGDPAAAADAV